MKNFIGLLVAVLIFAASSSELNAQRFDVDTDNSSIIWTGKKVTGQHTGTVDIQKAMILIDDGQVFGRCQIDMTTINCTDLEGDMKQQLEGHLKSEDFFDTEYFPGASLGVIHSEAVEGGDHNYLLTAALVIKGLSHEVTFPAQVDLTESGVTLNAKITIDRTKWHVRYGSGSFFDDLGDKMIYDDMEFDVQLTSK